MVVIKDVLDAIFPKETELRDCLSDPDIWLLWQRRHLIVHRRGIVDQSYLAKTSDVPQLGSRLSVSSGYVEASLLRVVGAATAVVTVLGKEPETEV